LRRTTPSSIRPQVVVVLGHYEACSDEVNGLLPGGCPRARLRAADWPPPIRSQGGQSKPPQSRGAIRPSCCCETSAQSKGRGECRVPASTRGLACEMKKHTSVVTTGPPDSPGIPARDGFNGFLRALPGDRAFLSPSPVEVTSTNLTPASRRQDHTTSPSAGRRVRLRAACVHRIPRPTFVTIAKRPFVWAGTRESIKLFLPGGEAKYFLKWGWTGIR
jgi:hypothetical protein